MRTLDFITSWSKMRVVLGTPALTAGVRSVGQTWQSYRTIPLTSSLASWAKSSNDISRTLVFNLKMFQKQNCGSLFSNARWLLPLPILVEEQRFILQKGSTKGSLDLSTLGAADDRRTLQTER